MWSVHASVEMELKGIPTATISTDAMAAMGQEAAKNLGFSSFPIMTIPHPAEWLTEPQLQKAADDIIEQIILAWTTPVRKLEDEYRDKFSYDTMTSPATVCQIAKHTVS